MPRESPTIASGAGRRSARSAPPDVDLTRRLARAIAGRREDFGDVAPDALWAALADNAVVVLLAARHREGSITGLDEALGERLALNEKAFALLDADHRRQAARLLDRLSAAGLDALLIKGLAVALRYYPDSRLRQRVDIDVYLRRDQESELRRVLEDAGYALAWHDRNPVTSHQFTATAPPPTMRPVVFDLHRRISNRAAFRDLMPFETLWASRQPLAGLHPAAFAPAAPYLLIHACLHRLAHGRGRETGRLAWLYDLHRLLEAMPTSERAQLADAATDMEVGTICAAALAECAALFDTDVPEDLLEQLGRRAREEPSAKLLDAGRLAWLWSDFSGQDGATDKLGFLRETLLNQVRRGARR